MNKLKVEWSERLKEQFIDEFLRRAALNSELEGLESLLTQLISTSFDGISPTISEDSRLFLVLESYRGLKGNNGNTIDAKAINLAQRIAPHLPGEKFWLVSPTDDKGVLFESEVAKVEVSLNSMNKK